MLPRDSGQGLTLVYEAAPPGRAPALVLVVVGGPCAGRRFVFHDRLEIGRQESGIRPAPGTLRVADRTVSARHCVVSQDAEGRCFVRDTSRNGTRINHHRVVPGTEVEIRPGEVLSVAEHVEFRLENAAECPPGEPEGLPRLQAPVPENSTAATSVDVTTVTVLMGDIREYTLLVQQAPPGILQRSLNALFQRLERRVADLDGTVKEYPGDAILAYWEADGPESCAARTCRAALALDQTALGLADDRTVWGLADHPLRMDWGLATGEVVIDSLGGAHPVGLSLVGTPVVLAHRLEKLADDHTGRILACSRTRLLAGDAFCFRDLGAMKVRGFTEPQQIFALEGMR